MSEVQAGAAPVSADSTVGNEIIALYREARAATAPDFKAWAMARARHLLPLHSTHWVNGVMTAQGAVFHHVSTEGLRPGYWERFQELMPIDPMGPRMFANPGISYLVGHDDFPAQIREELGVPFGVYEAVIGMAADAATGTFSVCCWYRDPAMARFTEANRRLHEQLLPHWVECLHLHRVTRVLRDLHAALVPGSLVALVEATGLIHYAQLGFGELIGEEFPGWPGTALPPPLLAALAQGEGGYEGETLSARWRAAPQQLWMVHARRSRPSRFGSQGQAREAEVRLLSASLEQREHELEAARRALLEREKQEAALQERQRILRELHDGVGAHLVGLRSLLQAGTTVTEDMAQALEAAMDEMRLAVDSMHTTGSEPGDLGELLAALRWRLQPRLEAAGITLQWSMPEPEVAAAACQGLSAGAALQVQRLLLEAFTNILKHAQASVVRVSFEARPHSAVGWQLLVRDNGVGLPAGLAGAAPATPAGSPPRGIGLGSMARRAAAIGALLEIGPSAGEPGALNEPHRGTVLRLRWPAPTASRPPQ